MKTGMLWFDDSARSLKIRVKEAVEYYIEKYGQAPTLCFVNPSMLSDKVKASNGVELVESRTVIPGHFWLGVGKVKTEKSNGRTTSTITKGRASSTKASG
jgi:hypothetical protein